METVKEIAFIDRDVPDIDSFVAGLRPDVEAIVLDSTEAASTRIAQTLLNRRQLSAVHVVAHGQPGQVDFAPGPLSVHTLGEHRDALRAIGRALREDGALLLWSCNSARGEDGQLFVDALASATGAKVGAASGLIGSAACRGTWLLHTGAGRAKADAPLTGTGQANYRGVLATFTGTAGNDTADDRSPACNGWALRSVRQAGLGAVRGGE